MKSSTDTMEKKSKNGLFAGGMVLIFVIGIFVGLVVGGFTHKGATTQQGVTTAQPYQLSLVEIMDVSFTPNKSLGAQPQFYVVGANGELGSSANITFPTNRKIIVTITSYDMGSAPTASQYSKVSGTVNDQITLIDGAIASGGNTSLIWKTEVSSVPVSKIIHTFTIPSLHINIPVIAGYTETAVIPPISKNKAGSYNWQCEAACGSGKSGWEGPMATPGWMMGTVNVV